MQAPDSSSFELLIVICLGVRFRFLIVIHKKGRTRFQILVMARRFAFPDQDMLLHAFRFSSFSVDIPGGRCGEAPSAGSHPAGLASLKKEERLWKL